MPPFNSLRTAVFLVGLVAAVFLANFIVLAWTEPGSTPPSGNVPAPVNVGSTAQTKTGALTVTALTASSTNDEKLRLTDDTTRYYTFNVGDDGAFALKDEGANVRFKIDNSGNILFSILTSCSTIDTDANGKLVCGTDAVDDSVSGSELDGVFASNGILRRTAAGTYSAVTDNSDYWITSAGTSGQVWKSDGSGAGVWGEDIIDDTVSSAELDNVCGTDSKILKRISGTWQCADLPAASGDITGVTAGQGLSGGGTLGDVTLNVKDCAANEILKRNAADTDWVCMADSGITSESDPEVGTLTSGKWCTSNGSSVNCASNAPLTSEDDPQVGTLTNTKWCKTDGSAVNCTSDAPSVTETDPLSVHTSGGGSMSGGSYYMNWSGTSNTYIGNNTETSSGRTYMDGELNFYSYDGWPKLDYDGYGRNGEKEGYVLGDLVLGSCSNRGELRISNNSRCNRDSICYCGNYDGSLKWICLISCN